MLSRIYDFIPIHMFTFIVNYGFHLIRDTVDSRCFPNYYKYRTIVMGQWQLYDMLITPSMVYDVLFLPPPLSCLGILSVFTFVCLFDTCMALIITNLKVLELRYVGSGKEVDSKTFLYKSKYRFLIMGTVVCCLLELGSLSEICCIPDVFSAAG
jgi:hypothetical protein